MSDNKEKNFTDLLMSLLKSKDEKMFNIISKIMSNNINISDTPEYSYLNSAISLLKKEVKDNYTIVKSSMVFITKDIKTLSKSIENIVNSINSIVVSMEAHAKAIEDLYKAQEILLSALKTKSEDTYLLPSEKKIKKDNKPN